MASPAPTPFREGGVMKMPPWLRIEVKIEFRVKVTMVLRWSPHLIGWSALIGCYVLTRGQGHLPLP
jgi:hypothetical protein